MNRRDLLKVLAGTTLGLLFSSRKARAATTTKDHHVWCDGNLGNDSNDGLTPHTPTKTIQAAIDRLPKVGHSMTVHLSGTFSPFLDRSHGGRDPEVFMYDGDPKPWGRQGTYGAEFNYAWQGRTRGGVQKLIDK